MQETSHPAALFKGSIRMHLAISAWQVQEGSRVRLPSNSCTRFSSLLERSDSIRPAVGIRGLFSCPLRLESDFWQLKAEIRFDMRCLYSITDSTDILLLGCMSDAAGWLGESLALLSIFLCPLS